MVVYLSIRGADNTLYEDSESHRMVIQHSNVKECIPNGASRRNANGVMCSVRGDGMAHNPPTRSLLFCVPQKPTKGLRTLLV